MERLQPGSGKIPTLAELASDGEKPERVHHRGVHPLPQVACIVPASDSIHVRATVAAPCIVEMTNGVYVRNGDATSLRIVIAHDKRKKAPPGIRPDEEWRRKFFAGADLIEPLPGDVAEVTGKHWL